MEQHLLAIPASTGPLLISRTGYAAGRPVEWRKTLIRGDRLALLAEFSARTGYRLAPGTRYPAPRAGRPPSPGEVAGMASRAGPQWENRTFGRTRPSHFG